MHEGHLSALRTLEISNSKFHKVGIGNLQRLAFLGDSVLDLLVPSHLFQTYTDIDQGELTDLRLAVVSDGSTTLTQKITEYYNRVEWRDNCTLVSNLANLRAPR